MCCRPRTSAFSFRGASLTRQKSGVPAKAGTHSSAVSEADKWVPAFAGTPIWALPQRALEDLVDIGVGQRLQRFRPLPAIDLATLGSGAHPAVPADLLHVVIE